MKGREKDGEAKGGRVWGRDRGSEKIEEEQKESETCLETSFPQLGITLCIS